jgi:uncharacterized membrane protein
MKPLFRPAHVWLPTALAALLGLAHPAIADFVVRNDTGAPVSVAVKYHLNEYWTSGPMSTGTPAHWHATGWFTIMPNKQVTVVPGSLRSRYIYLYAESSDGRQWGGQFTGVVYNIGFEYDLYDKSDNSYVFTNLDKQAPRRDVGFVRVDTGESPNWIQTINP